jgi:hypothetical protein
VIGRLVDRDHAKRDVVMTAALDRARRPHPDRVGIDEQPDHHHGIVRRSAMAIVAVTRTERPEIQLANRVEHKPCEVILRQPLTQARRQQQLLLTITRDEVLRHPEIVLNPPDAIPVSATPSARRSTLLTACRSVDARRKQPSAATARVRRDDRLGRSAVTFRSVVKAHIHRPPSCEILRQPLHVAAAAEVAEYRRHMRLSGKIRRCGKLRWR